MSLRARQVPRAGRRDRVLAGLRGHRLSHRALRRRDRTARDYRPADRLRVRHSTQDIYIYPAKHFVLPEERIQSSSKRSNEELDSIGSSSSRIKESCSKPSGWRRNPVRYGDVASKWAIVRESRTTSRPLSDRKPGEAPEYPARLLPRRTACYSSTNRMSRDRKSGGCSRATSAGRARWSSTAFGCPSALDNRPLRFDEWEKKLGRRASMSRPRPGTMRSPCPAEKSSSR